MNPYCKVLPILLLHIYCLPEQSVQHTLYLAMSYIKQQCDDRCFKPKPRQIRNTVNLGSIKLQKK